MKKFLLIAAFALFAFAGSLKAQYTTTTPVTGLAYPIAFTFAPDGRYLVTLKGGEIKIFNADGSAIGTFYNLTDSTFNDFERGLLGIEVDPDFAINHYVYAYYNHRYPNTSAGNTTQKLRVVRFTENNNVGTNPTMILSITPGYTLAGNHVGGNLHFGPDGKLYVTIGELAVPANAQMLTNPYGKFLRLNKDGSIPTDNPFYDDGNPAAGNDDRIWSYGHRNPFDFCFSPVNDSLYSTENGQNTWDEMNIVTRGKNYGWNPCEGDYLINSTSNPCTNPNYVNPIETWGSPLPAVTGIVHYTSCLMPEFQNHLIVGDNDNGYIYDVTLGNAPAYNVVTARTQVFDVSGLTTIRMGTDGYIYALNGGYAPQGRIYKIGPTNAPTAPTATFTYPNVVCYGDSFVVTYTGTGTVANDYDWTITNGTETFTFNSQGPHLVYPTQPGNYSIQLEVSDGCLSSATTTGFTVNPQLGVDVIVVNPSATGVFDGGFSATANGGTPGYTYQWICPNGFVSTNQDIVNMGTNAPCLTCDLAVIDMNSCIITTTATLCNPVGVLENAISPVKVYPNPASSKLFIDLKGTTAQTFNAQIFNSIGALVASQTVNGKALVELDVNSLPSGIYTVLLNGNKSRYAARWIKN